MIYFVIAVAKARKANDEFLVQPSLRAEQSEAKQSKFL